MTKNSFVFGFTFGFLGGIGFTLGGFIGSYTQYSWFIPAIILGGVFTALLIANRQCMLNHQNHDRTANASCLFVGVATASLGCTNDGYFFKNG